MIRGLYTAATGMLANQKRIEAVSNNLSNVQTVAWKRDEVFSESFNNVLLFKQNGTRYVAEDVDRPNEVSKDDDGFYTVSTKEGYFRVETSRGVSNNKEMKFHVNQEGFLSTYYLNSNRQLDLKRGHKVLDQAGQAIQVGNGNLEIKANGDVMVDGETKANLIYHPPANAIGTINGGVLMNRRYIDFEQGQFLTTNEDYDMAIKGEGFFRIQLDDIEIYTRNGQLKLDSKNTLVTGDGYPILGFNGPITLKDEKFTINEFGEIIQGGEIIDKLSMINFSNFGDLVRIGGTYYQYSTEPMGEIIDFEGEIRQGNLEESNTNSITEMIRMVNLQREYESSSRAVRTIDEMIQKAVNEVGSL